MDGPFLSSLRSDFSTGYLEDALFEFNGRSKRRRLEFYNDDDHAPTKLSSESDKCYWNQNCSWDSSEAENFSCISHITGITQGLSGQEDKKRVKKRVVYPFALIKPGGTDGDMTINDINERMLMAPTRPVRHPVGDFACRPCVSAAGPGLSGKSVVALTRIHTQGRGSITIIRTTG